MELSAALGGLRTLPDGADADLLLELVSGSLLYHRVLTGQDVDRALVERVVDVALAGVRHG